MHLSTSQFESDEIPTWEITVIETRRKTFIVEAFNEEQAFDRYLADDYLEAFERTLDCEVESTVPSGEMPIRSHSLNRLLGKEGRR